MNTEQFVRNVAILIGHLGHNLSNNQLDYDIFFAVETVGDPRLENTTICVGVSKLGLAPEKVFSIKLAQEGCTLLRTHGTETPRHVVTELMTQARNIMLHDGEDILKHESDETMDSCLDRLLPDQTTTNFGLDLSSVRTLLESLQKGEAGTFDLSRKKELKRRTQVISERATKLIARLRGLIAQRKTANSPETDFNKAVVVPQTKEMISYAGMIKEHLNKLEESGERTWRSEKEEDQKELVEA